MGPKTPVAQSYELFRQPLREMLNAKHPIMKLAQPKPSKLLFVHPPKRARSAMWMT